MTNIINPMPELEVPLKRLRLSGILESLYQRNKEAVENKMAYPEFLALLIQDEILRREQNKYVARIKRAGFKTGKTIESFDFEFNQKINQKQIIDLTTCQFIREKVCVLLMGPCGTGKSHIAQAIGHCATQKGVDVLFSTLNKLLDEFNVARATGTYKKKMASLIKVPLLIIDDFGLKPMQGSQDEDFHDLMAERYETTATILTSNLDFSEWSEVFRNRLLGAATLDRIRHGAYSILLEGESYRAAKNKNSTSCSLETAL